MAALVAAVLLAFLISEDAQGKPGCKTRACELRVLDRQCSQRRVLPCIQLASSRARLGPWQRAWMLRVARCESGLNPYARNPSGASGTYQFMPGTFRAFGGRGSIWSAREQARVAAWAVKRGLRHHWQCR